MKRQHCMLLCSLVQRCDADHVQSVRQLTTRMGVQLFILLDIRSLFRSIISIIECSARITSAKQAWRMSLPHVLSTAVCLVALAWSTLSTASYLIQLRNGRQVVASRYWQEEHTIRFETDGGVASVAESA